VSDNHLAAVLGHDETIKDLTYERVNELSILQAEVGGYVEAITMPSGRIMWVNEEGLMKGLPLNRLATTLLHRLGAVTSVRILGNAVITGPADSNGDTRSLTAAEVEELRAELMK
jgi:hypothetical protein